MTTKKRERLSKETRRDQILAAAVDLAKSKGFPNITRDGIAARAGVSVGLVSHYWGTMPQLRRDVMRAAVRDEVLPVIAYGLAVHDAHALKAPPDVRRRALEFTINATR